MSRTMYKDNNNNWHQRGDIQKLSATPMADELNQFGSDKTEDTIQGEGQPRLDNIAKLQAENVERTKQMVASKDGVIEESQEPAVSQEAPQGGLQEVPQAVSQEAPQEVPQAVSQAVSQAPIMHQTATRRKTLSEREKEFDSNKIKEKKKERKEKRIKKNKEEEYKKTPYGNLNTLLNAMNTGNEKIGEALDNGKSSDPLHMYTYYTSEKEKIDKAYDFLKNNIDEDKYNSDEKYRKDRQDKFMSIAKKSSLKSKAIHNLKAGGIKAMATANNMLFKLPTSGLRKVGNDSIKEKADFLAEVSDKAPIGEQIFAGLVGGGKVAHLGKGLIKGGTRAGKMAKGITGGAVAGAGLGAVENYGKATTSGGGTKQSAIEGAKMGALLGAGLSTAGRVVKNTGSKIFPKLTKAKTTNLIKEVDKEAKGSNMEFSSKKNASLNEVNNEMAIGLVGDIHTSMKNKKVSNADKNKISNIPNDLLKKSENILGSTKAKAQTFQDKIKSNYNLLDNAKIKNKEELYKTATTNIINKMSKSGLKIDRKSLEKAISEVHKRVNNSTSYGGIIQKFRPEDLFGDSMKMLEVPRETTKIINNELEKIVIKAVPDYDKNTAKKYALSSKILKDGLFEGKTFKNLTKDLQNESEDIFIKKYQKAKDKFNFNGDIESEKFFNDGALGTVLTKTDGNLSMSNLKTMQQAGIINKAQVENINTLYSKGVKLKDLMTALKKAGNLDSGIIGRKIGENLASGSTKIGLGFQGSSTGNFTNILTSVTSLFGKDRPPIPTNLFTDSKRAVANRVEKFIKEVDKNGYDIATENIYGAKRGDKFFEDLLSIPDIFITAPAIKVKTTQDKEE